MKTRIFTDRTHLTAGRPHVTMLYPFWGKNPEDPRHPASGRYDRYIETGRQLFEMTALDEADVAVLPEGWEHVVGDRAAIARAERFLEAARRAGKPAVVFFWSDLDDRVPYEHTLVFRTSLYRSRRDGNEFAMPAWSEDFVARYMGGQLPRRFKRAKPVVGFCGYVPVAPPPRPRAWSVLQWRGTVPTRLGRVSKVGGAIRGAALEALASVSSIETNLVIREQFLGSASLPSGEPDYARMQAVRDEYVKNLVDSDYVLCVRGGGNFSYRLYETLCCGRIPVFVDTECVLPYDSAVNWKDYCVWVDERDVRRIGERVAAFHDSLSDRQFEELQAECRRLWEDRLRPEGFFGHFHEYLGNGKAARGV